MVKQIRINRPIAPLGLFTIEIPDARSDSEFLRRKKVETAAPRKNWTSASSAGPSIRKNDARTTFKRKNANAALRRSVMVTTLTAELINNAAKIKNLTSLIVFDHLFRSFRLLIIEFRATLPGFPVSILFPPHMYIISASAAGSASAAYRLLSAFDNDCVDFHQSALGQSGDLNCGPGGIWFLEKLAIHLIDHREIP